VVTFADFTNSFALGAAFAADPPHSRKYTGALPRAARPRAESRFC